MVVLGDVAVVDAVTLAALDLDRVLLLGRGVCIRVLVGLVGVRRLLVLLDVVPSAVAVRVAAAGGLALVVGLGGVVAVGGLCNGARVVAWTVVAVAVPVALVRAVELDRVLLLGRGLGAGVLIGLVVVRRLLVLLDVVARAVSGDVSATGGLVLRVALVGRIVIASRSACLGVVALRGVAVVVVVTLV